MEIHNRTDQVILVSLGGGGEPVRVEGGARSVVQLPGDCGADRTIRIFVEARTEGGEELVRDVAPCGVGGFTWVFHPDGTSAFETESR
jgi:hypothetical protein